MTLPARSRRGVPPAKTFPPDDDLETTVKRVGWFKGLLAAGVATAAVGWGAAVWSAKHATKEDVSKGQAMGAATVADLSRETQAIRIRIAVVEAGLTDLKADVTFIRDQLVEITKAVGARRVPEPQAVTTGAP